MRRLRCADVTSMHDVLSMCRLSLFAHSLSVTLIRSSCISLVTPTLSLAETQIAVSSAYMFVCAVLKTVRQVIDVNGKKEEPCGTPVVIVRVYDTDPLMQAIWVRFSM